MSTLSNPAGNAIGDPSQQMFDAAMRACAVEVPPDWRDGALAVHRELTAMAALLRQPRDPESEPGFVFRIEDFIRSPE